MNYEYGDYVRCCNCGFVGVVEIGAEKCPKCEKSGMLTWVDETKKEVAR